MRMSMQSVDDEMCKWLASTFDRQHFTYLTSFFSSLEGFKLEIDPTNPTACRCGCENLCGAGE
jgi:hypothetical protein